MNKEQKEQFKKEKTDLLELETIKLEKEIEYIQNRHTQKLKELSEKLDALRFQRDIFKELTIK